jgi:multiple sugar transport system permease protein
MLAVALAFVLPLQWMLATALAPADQPLDRAGHVVPRFSERDRLTVQQRRERDEARAASLRARLEAMTPDDDRPLPPGSPAYWSALRHTAADNLGSVWNSPVADFPIYLRNTLIVTLLSVIGMVLSSAVVAYGFSRLRWRGRDGLFLLVLATMMVPFPVIMAPLYILFRHLGWIGSFKPLWVPTFFGGAFSIFLLRQFFLTIPRALDEAAMIDGCSSVGIFVRIILPLSRPALLVVALFQCIASWNDFVGPLIFLNHQETYTLALGLFMYQSQHGGTPWNLVMAASVLITVPILIVFLVAQRQFIEGIATKGIKG